jgi:hypothetical protein
MRNQRDAINGLFTGLKATEIAVKDLNVADVSVQVLTSSGRVIVQDPDDCTLGNQGVDQVGANESRATGHQDVRLREVKL